MTDAQAVLTISLPRGREVLARLTKRGLVAVTYANWTQARRKVDELGSGWGAWRGMGRAIYITHVDQSGVVSPPAASDAAPLLG